MVGKFFPITQGVACQLKWTWHTVHLYDGTSNSCHRVDSVALAPATFDNFHNHETWINQRKTMLEGKFPQAGCQYCENIEKNGGVSDRLTHLKIPNLSPRELDHDPLAVVVTPRILEVFLDNTCNMKCIYCDESNSSQIKAENLKYGHIKIKSVADPGQVSEKHPDFEALTDKFFEYLDKNYHQLRKLNVLGGEPFFQQSFERLFKFIQNNKNPDLELTIVTNLKLPKKTLEKFVIDIRQCLLERKIGRLDITASLDCFGEQQEYVRYGLDLDKFKENFEFLAQHRWITLNINSTITALTIKTMPDMIRYIKTFLKDRKIFWSFGLVDNRAWLNPTVFGGEFFKTDFENILREMPDSSDWDKNQRQYMEGISRYVSAATVDLDHMNNLIEYLDEIDRRRNLNWRTVFPWLDRHVLLIKGNHVV